MNRLEKLYRIFGWIEDIDTPEGRRRLERSIHVMSNIISHPSIAGLLERKGKIRILDVCSGMGVGFISLTKAIWQKYSVDIEVTAVDLRKQALEKAAEYAARELGIKLQTYLHDVTRLWELGLKADIALLYGFSTPHFNPYDIVKLSAGVAETLDNDGVFLVEESDRVYSLYQRVGYKWVTPERVDEENVVLSIEDGRVPRKGTNRRLIMDLVTGERVMSEIRLWDIAGTASILWCFFKHVDIFEYRSPYSGIIIAWRPRDVKASWYTGYPEIVSDSGGSR